MGELGVVKGAFLAKPLGLQDIKRTDEDLLYSLSHTKEEVNDVVNSDKIGTAVTATQNGKRQQWIT